MVVSQWNYVPRFSKKWLVKGFLIFLTGWVAFQPGVVLAQSPGDLHQEPQLTELEKKLLTVPSPERARTTLRAYTAKPHLAGTPEDYETARFTQEEFRKAGLQAELVEYEAWMPYPKSRLVEIVAPVKFTASLTEPVQPEDFDSKTLRSVPTYSAYSPSGDVTADVVYANYGLPQDFDALQRLGVDVKGKIILVRYGAAYRGVKAKVAEERGAAGVLIFSDPKDDGFVRGETFPNGPFRPDTCVQRGSINYIFNYPGDPLTPGVAATKNAKRIQPIEAKNLPRIPVQPLSYRDALPILENLGGQAVPEGWQGGLPIPYRTGPGPTKVHLKLQMEYKSRKIWNVIGTIPGKSQPDEWVLLGNHRDAWVYGAVDPSSGSTALLEVARSFGELLKQGWRPHRTLKLCSWDGEEFGLIGSTEWAEDNAAVLKEKAIAYLNVDVAVCGGNFGSSAVPSLWPLLRGASRVVLDADGKQTLHGSWIARNPDAIEIGIGQLGGGSDFVPFLNHLGIPAADMGMGGPYGVYHSTYDSFFWMEKFGDPGFTRHATMARMWSLVAYRLVDLPTIQLNLSEYAHELLRLCFDLEKSFKETPGKPEFTQLNLAATQLVLKAEAFERSGDTPATLAARNRKRRQFERALTDEKGLPGRPWFRHLVYSPGVYSGYGAEVFSGIRHALNQKRPEEARQAVDQLAAALNRAIEVLK
ncbi:MAG TPA: M28 family metallopeptidase [Acidobacteriota bacterium]|nr:M28 family metallopeptidase [Acidobacteriota bacterium]HND20680.1 M28 family metallopeptidase [Acidobacteriota bacterium]